MNLTSRDDRSGYARPYLIPIYLRYIFMVDTLFNGYINELHAIDKIEITEIMQQNHKYNKSNY